MTMQVLNAEQALLACASSTSSFGSQGLEHSSSLDAEQWTKLTSLHLPFQC